MGILKLTFFVSARQNVIWLSVSESTLNLMSWACKEYMSTSEIRTFDSRVKQKVFNNEKRCKRQSLIPVYATFYRSIMTLKWHFPLFDFSANRIKRLRIYLMLD